MRPRNIPLGSFKNNVAHSARRNGLMVDRLQNMDGTVANDPYLPRKAPYGKDDPVVKVTAVFSDSVFYKNRRHGAWFRGQAMHFMNLKFFDNRAGFNGVVMPGLIENSLFVCETPNIGTPINGLARSTPDVNPNHAIWGYENYDAFGGQFQRNNEFRNCRPNALRDAACISAHHDLNILGPLNRYNKLKFDSSPRFFWPRFPNKYSKSKEEDSMKFITVLDNDGSSTGAVGTWVMPTEAFHTYGRPGCKLNKRQNVRTCAADFEGRVFFNIDNADIRNTDFAGTNKNADSPWIRSTWYHLGDTQGRFKIGTVGWMPQSATRTKYRANLIARKGYYIEFPHNTPPKMKLSMLGAAQGDYIVACFKTGRPKPGEIKRDSWPKAIFKEIKSLNDMVADTYHYSSAGHLCVRVENMRYAVEQHRGFVRQRSWGTEVQINLSCGKRCGRGGPVSPALPKFEDSYRADLCGNSNTYGTAFFGYDSRTNKLLWQIYHGLDNRVTGAHLHNRDTNAVVLDLGVAFAPMEGIAVISADVFKMLFEGKLYVNIHTKQQPSGELKGNIGCVGKCAGPPAVSSQKPCSLGKQGNVLIASNKIVNTGGDNKSWRSSSWLATIAESYRREKVCGAGSMKVTMTKGSFVLHNRGGGVSMPSDSFIQFWVKSLSGSITLTVAPRIVGAASLKSIKVTPEYIRDSEIKTSWTRVKMPLSLWPVGSKKIEQIKIRFDNSWKWTTAKSFVISDYRLIGNVADPNGGGASGNAVAFRGQRCYKNPASLFSATAVHRKVGAGSIVTEEVDNRVWYKKPVFASLFVVGLICVAAAAIFAVVLDVRQRNDKQDDVAYIALDK